MQKLHWGIVCELYVGILFCFYFAVMFFSHFANCPSFQFDLVVDSFVRIRTPATKAVGHHLNLLQNGFFHHQCHLSHLHIQS